MIDKYTEKTDKNQQKVSQGVQHLQKNSMFTSNRKLTKYPQKSNLGSKRTKN